MVLSIGIFFIADGGRPGRYASGRDVRGPRAQGVPAADAHSDLAPATGGRAVRVVPRLQPDQGAAGAARDASTCRHSHAAYLTGRSFFPGLISKPFSDGLHDAFDFAIVACLIAAAASWLRGGKYVNDEGMPEHITKMESVEGVELALAGEGD